MVRNHGDHNQHNLFGDIAGDPSQHELNKQPDYFYGSLDVSPLPILFSGFGYLASG